MPSGSGTHFVKTTTFTPGLGYGWQSGTVSSVDRTTPTALRRDFNATADATFAVALANGTYQVTVTLGDQSAARDNQRVFLEGEQVETLTTGVGAFFARTYLVTVRDGQLTLRLQDLGGASSTAALGAIEIDRLFATL